MRDTQCLWRGHSVDEHRPSLPLSLSLSIWGKTQRRLGSQKGTKVKDGDMTAGVVGLAKGAGAQGPLPLGQGPVAQGQSEWRQDPLSSRGPERGAERGGGGRPNALGLAHPLRRWGPGLGACQHQRPPPPVPPEVTGGGGGLWCGRVPHQVHVTLSLGCVAKTEPRDPPQTCGRLRPTGTGTGPFLSYALCWSPPARLCNRPVFLREREGGLSECLFFLTLAKGGHCGS